jgi:hypothetical protein
MGEKSCFASLLVIQPGVSYGSILIDAASNALLLPSSRCGPKGEPRDHSSGLNSLRQTLDSVARLAGYAGGAQVNVAVQTNVSIDLAQIAERLIQRFDHQPEVKAQIAQALLEIDNEQSA